MINFSQLLIMLILLIYSMSSKAADVSSYGDDKLQFVLTTQNLDSRATANLENQKLLKLKILQNGKTIPGFRPKAWLSLRRSEQVADETSCSAKIKSFLSGQLSTRADVDLNSYLLLTLNQDKTITFIDPQSAWSSSKLQAIVQLPAQGLDWLLSKDGKWLYVTLPDVSAVALIETKTHTLVETIAVGKETKPTRLSFSPDEKSVWVGLDNSPYVAVIDRGVKHKVKQIEVGDGLHQIAFTPDSALALVTNTKANTVSVVDAVKQVKLVDITVGNTPLKPVWMPKAERFYVPSINDSVLSVIDPVKREVEARIDINQGLVEAAVDPDGRYLWLVNSLESKTYVVDTATNQVVAYAKLSANPDQIAFTADYAYFRGLGSEKFALVNRQQLAKLPSLAKQQTTTLNELSVTQIQAGEKPPVVQSDAIGVAPMIVPIPENNGVMVASAPGKTIYYYTEGMMVPMGTLDNYQRAPRGLMVLNRSLQETSPGVFEVPVNIQKSGNYDVAVLIDQPRIVHCFTAKLAANVVSKNPEKPLAAKVNVQLLPLKKSPKANQQARLIFKLEDSKSKQTITGIQGARVLIFEPPGLWQKRIWLQETKPGFYQASVSFPHAGNFNLLVEASSRSLGFNDQDLALIKVEANTNP